MTIKEFYKRVVALHDYYFDFRQDNRDVDLLGYYIYELLDVFLLLPNVEGLADITLVEASRYYLQELQL